MNVRPYLPIVFAVVVTGAAVFIAASFYDTRRRARFEAAGQEIAAAAKRTTPVLDAAPAPLPTALPLLGPGGADAEGFPNKWVDQAALRSLLWHKQFVVLDQYLGELVEAFEKDDKFERWPIDGFAAFHSADPMLGRDLDAWLAADDASYMAHLARAEHWVATGMARRGTEWTKDTPPEQFAGMNEAFARARVDIDRALAVHPKLIPAYRLRILMGAAASASERERARDDALAACPRCVDIRWTWLVNATPRWGGSYEAMTAFAVESARATPSSRARSLRGAADYERAEIALLDGALDEAKQHADRAVAAGDHWAYFMTRADVEARQGDKAGSEADLEKARALRPDQAQMLAQRAAVLFRLARYQDAAVAFLAAARVDTTNHSLQSYQESIRKGLVSDAFKADGAGDHPKALELYALAGEVAPNHGDTLRFWVPSVIGKDPPSEAELARQIEARPDDFELRRRLDCVLARTKQFARIAASWDGYLAKHPDDARALVERAGTRANLHQKPEAAGDALRACELGSNQGCALAKQLGAR